MTSGKILLLILLTSTASVLGQEYETVSTCSGKVKGIVEYHDNKKIYNFRGIPYAKPPIGDLRFRKPQPYGSWENTLDATNFSSSCMQMSSPANSEDCLYLNIYVPHNVSSSNNMAVMVWIHGGGYSLGEGKLYNGAYLAVKGGVIVVTFNYRLGIFGFLSTDDKASPGNYGLWDQIMVFQWVKSNIGSFGGNPNAITIFGQSAGAMSVSFQALIPHNKGLFQRAIAESGTTTSSPVIADSTKFMEFLNGKFKCTSTSQINTSELVQCLKQKTATELNAAGNEYLFSGRTTDQRIPIAPSIDGELLISEPQVLFADKSSYAYKFFKSIDFMAGTTNGEGSVLLGTLAYYSHLQILNFNLTEGIPKSYLCSKFSPDMAKVYFKNSPKAVKALCDKYSYHGSDEDQMAQQGRLFVDMFTDLYMIAPTVETLRAHAEANSEGKSYQYFFTRAVPGMFGSYNPSWFTKAGHGAELAYLFGPDEWAENYKANVTNEDYILEDKMIEYWSNFAKTGNPNSPSLPVWNEYGQGKSYLEIGLNITSKQDLFPDKMKFILEDLPRLIQPVTFPPIGSACQYSVSLYFTVPFLCCVSFLYTLGY